MSRETNWLSPIGVEVEYNTVIDAQQQKDHHRDLVLRKLGAMVRNKGISKDFPRLGRALPKEYRSLYPSVSFRRAEWSATTVYENGKTRRKPGKTEPRNKSGPFIQTAGANIGYVKFLKKFQGRDPDGNSGSVSESPYSDMSTGFNPGGR